MKLEKEIEKYLNDERFYYRTHDKMQRFILKCGGQEAVRQVDDLLAGWWENEKIPPEEFYETVARAVGDIPLYDFFMDFPASEGIRHVARAVGDIPLYDLLKSRCRPAAEWSLVKAVRYLGSNLKKGIVDAGCGTGLEAAFLAKHYRGAEVICIETSKAMAKATRDRFARLGINNAKVIEDDMGNIEKYAAGLDGVICVNCLNEGQAFRDAAADPHLQIFYNAMLVDRLKKLKGALAQGGRCINYFGIRGSERALAYEKDRMRVVYDTAGLHNIETDNLTYKNKDKRSFIELVVCGEA